MSRATRASLGSVVATLLALGGSACGTKFQTTYGTGGAEVATDVESTPSGGYLVAGYAQASPSAPVLPIWIELGTDGALLGVHGDGNESLNHAINAVAPLGTGFALAGWSQSVTGADVAYLAITDASLTVTTVHTYTALANAEDVRETSDHGLIVAGSTAGNQGALLKLDPNGAVVFARTLGATPTLAQSDLRSVRELPAAGGYVVCGTGRVAGGQVQPYLYRFAADGALLGATALSVSHGAGECAAVRAAPGGGFQAAGTDELLADLGTTWNVRRWIVDASGVETGAATYVTASPHGVDYAADLAVLADGGAAILATGCNGDTLIDCTNPEQFALLRILPDGSLDYRDLHGGARDSFAYGLRASADGGFVLAGSTAAYGAGGDDIYVVKTDASGATGEPPA